MYTNDLSPTEKFLKRLHPDHRRLERCSLIRQFISKKKMLQESEAFALNSPTRRVIVKDSLESLRIKLEIHTKGYMPFTYLVHIIFPLPMYFGEFLKIEIPNRDINVPKIKSRNNLVTDVNALADYVYYIHRIKTSKMLDLDGVLKNTHLPTEIIKEIGYYLLPL